MSEAEEPGAEPGQETADSRRRRRRESLPVARHRARVIALQSLYEADQTGHDPATTVARLTEAENAVEEADRYARRLIAGIKESRAQLDALISETAPQWPVEQLAVVDRNILRIAIYEMLLDGETPVGVAVDEAVELAKAFGAESTPRFVNGVLGALSARAGGEH